MDVAIGAGSDELGLQGVLAEKHEEVEVVGYTESADESVVDAFVEAEVFVVGSQAVYVVAADEYDVVDKWASASEMVDPLVLLLIDDFNIFLVVGQDS